MKTGRDDWDAMIRVAGIPSDEPTFLLRGQNETAADRVREWCAIEIERGTPVCVIEQALRQADAMEKWPVKKLITAAHLSEDDQKQLTYAYGRRVWRRGLMTREATAGALMLDLIQNLLDAPVTAELIGFKTQAEALSEVLTGGRPAAIAPKPAPKPAPASIVTTCERCADTGVVPLSATDQSFMITCPACGGKALGEAA